MEQINFDLNKQLIQNLKDKNVSSENLYTKDTNIKFDELLSDINNDKSDVTARNIIKNLSQKYHVNITVTPNETDRDVIKEGNFSVIDASGCNNSVIIPRNLLNKMTTDSKIMKNVEYAIKRDIDGFRRTESLRVATGEKITYSSPLTFTEDGNWSTSCSSVSESFSSGSKKLGIIQSDEYELELLKQKLSNKDLNKNAIKIGKTDNNSILESSLNIQSLSNIFNTSLDGINNFNYYNSINLDRKKDIKVYK